MYKQLALLALATACFGPTVAKASPPCRADIADADGYTILSVVPNVRWGAALSNVLPVKRGDAYTQANVDAARQAFQKELERQNSASLVYLDRISARYIAPCTIVEEQDLCRSELQKDKCITLRVDVYAVHIPALDTASLVPDRPRSATDTNLGGVPKPLLALAPRMGVTRDSALGTVVGFQTATELEQLARTLLDRPIANVKPSKTQVLLQTRGERAADSRYYRGSADLTLARTLNSVIKELDATSSFHAVNSPFGDTFLRRNEFALGGAAVVNTPVMLFRSVLGGVSYRRLNTALADLTAHHDTENALGARIAVDGILWHAPLRMAAWIKHSVIDTGGSYQTFVARAGYQKSFALRPHQTIGVEILGGYGVTSPLTLPADRFAGGSDGVNFLNDDFSAFARAAPATGPIIRSIGAGRLDWSERSPAGARETFFHLNATFSIPVGLSRPLIPAFEPIPGVSVSDLIKARVDKDNLLKATLESQGYTPEAAQAEQDRVMNAVRPAVHFIADNANIWSIKPILAFDYARTRFGSLPGGTGSWPAAGAGLQLEVVTAQFQFGYMHLLPSSSGPRVGNFFVRLIFQNLF